MAMTTVRLKVDETGMVSTLREARETLDGTASEVVLEFSSVLRIDSSALHALETLAGSAEGKNIKVVLHGVNVDVYKVLKLVKLARRFSFVN